MTQDSTTVRTVTDAIDHTASNLRVPAAHVWAVLERQALVEAAQNAILFIVALGVAVIPILMWRRIANASADMNYWGAWDDESAIFGTMIVTVASIIFLVAALSGFIQGIGYAINPEYYALKTVLGVLK